MSKHNRERWQIKQHIKAQVELPEYQRTPLTEYQKIRIGRRGKRKCRELDKEGVR